MSFGSRIAVIGSAINAIPTIIIISSVGVVHAVAIASAITMVPIITVRARIIRIVTPICIVSKIQ